MANVAKKGTFATYSGANLNEIFYEPVFRSDDIMRNYRVIPNVKHKMNVYTSAALTKSQQNTQIVHQQVVQLNLILMRKQLLQVE